MLLGITNKKCNKQEKNTWSNHQMELNLSPTMLRLIKLTFIKNQNKNTDKTSLQYSILLNKYNLTNVNTKEEDQICMNNSIINKP